MLSGCVVETRPSQRYIAQAHVSHSQRKLSTCLCTVKEEHLVYVSCLHAHTSISSHKHVPGLGNIFSAFRDNLEFHQRQILQQHYVWHGFYEHVTFP
jgi:hypothetical protein